VIPDRSKTLDQGAIEPWTHERSGDSYYRQLLEAAAAQQGIPMDVPARKLPASQLNIVLYGGRRGEKVKLHYKTAQGLERTYETHFEGVIPNLQRRHREASSDHAREQIERYMAERNCPACQGRRLKPEALAVTVVDKAIDEVTAMSVTDMLAWFDQLQSPAGTPADEGDGGGDEGSLLTKRQQTIARQIIKELRDRLSFMANVGLDYLTIDRRAATLFWG
jgi:excinuclease ABC subunit A